MPEPYATRLWNRSCVQQPIPISGGFFYSPERASEIVGVSNRTLFIWAKAQITSYGFPLNVIEYQNHRLIDERDVHVLAAVQKDFPVGGGPIPTNKREQMKRYAAQVRAKLTR